MKFSKINKISFIPVFWYFIKEIALYDVEYGLNFDKNAKNADVSKKSCDNHNIFGMLLSKLTHGGNLR